MIAPSMKQSIALIRGINVGGNHIILMKDLREFLETIGLQKVQSYIQSGNLVFNTPNDFAESQAELGIKLEKAILTRFGISAKVMIRDAQSLSQAIDNCPFINQVTVPNRLLILFLEDAPKSPDLLACQALCASDETFALCDDIFYLYAPTSLADSKLAQKCDKLLGVSSTARNLNTVRKLYELAVKHIDQ